MGKKVKHVFFDKRMRAWVKQAGAEADTKDELLGRLWTSLTEMSSDPEQSKFFGKLFAAIESEDAAEVKRLWDEVEERREKVGHTAGILDFDGTFVCMRCLWAQARKYGRPFNVQEIVTWQDILEQDADNVHCCKKCGKSIHIGSMP